MEPGAAEHYEGQDLEALADIPNYQRWILRHFRAHLHGRVLEIGAGIGTFAGLYLDQVREAVLLEPARNLAATLRERFAGDPRVTVEARMLEETTLAPGFDAVVLINVLEHVDDDRAMLERIRALLAPGGHLLLFVPALAWLYGTLDSLVHHRRRYSRPSLRAVVEAAGLEIRELRYFDVLGVLPWLVTGRVVRARRFSPAAATLYDRVGVPLGSLVERLVAPPLGKNLMCVARRR